MYPDGGFARLRLYGHVVPPALPTTASTANGISNGTTTTIIEEELSSALMGGIVLSASDQHYTPASNILLPGRGKDMGDGWETARSRAPGHVDWVVVRLGLPAASVTKVVVDTKDFRGNFPREVRVHGLYRDPNDKSSPTHDDPGWTDLVRGDQPCKADTEHVFAGDQLTSDPGRVITHARLTLVPDGGVKRFRVFGQRKI
jgi:allantoicase